MNPSPAPSGNLGKVTKRKLTRSVSTLTPSQLARKRANDREAQKAIRARTKEHIERLEREVKELKSEQNRDVASELKKSMATANTIIEALRSPTWGTGVFEQLQHGESLVNIRNKLLDERASSSASVVRGAHSEFGGGLEPDAEGKYEDGGDRGPDDSETRSPSPFPRPGSAPAAFPGAQAGPSIPSNCSSSSIMASPAGGVQPLLMQWGETYEFVYAADPAQMGLANGSLMSNRAQGQQGHDQYQQAQHGQQQYALPLHLLQQQQQQYGQPGFQ